MVSGSWTLSVVIMVPGGNSSDILYLHGPRPHEGATSFLSRTVIRTCNHIKHSFLKHRDNDINQVVEQIGIFLKFMLPDKLKIDTNI